MHLVQKIAYDGLSYDDDPRQGEEVERMLGLSKGSKIVKQRMIVIGNSANIEMFEIVSDLQDGPLKLEDLGFNHISLFVENMDKAINDARDAGAISLSEKHDNSRYEDSDESSSVYLKQIGIYLLNYSQFLMAIIIQIIVKVTFYTLRITIIY